MIGEGSRVHVWSAQIHGRMFGQKRFTRACLVSIDSRVHVYLIVDVHRCTFGQPRFPGACLARKG